MDPIPRNAPSICVAAAAAQPRRVPAGSPWLVALGLTLCASCAPGTTAPPGSGLDAATDGHAADSAPDLGAAETGNRADAALDRSVGDSAATDAEVATDLPGPPPTDGSTATDSAPPPLLPGNRPTFVAALMGSHWNASWVRLAQYSFTAAGTVTEHFWYWSQQGFSGDASTNKVLTGYHTSGCLYDCPIKTPLGFEPGAAPKQLSGAWYLDVNGRLVITWAGGHLETWTVQTQPSIARMTLFNSNYGASVGWAYGSHATLDQGATVDQVQAAGSLQGDYWENAYASSTIKTTRAFHLSQYQRCSNSPCLQGKANTAADKTQWYHSYLAAEPAKLGRRMYWNHQLGVVAQAESPGTLCISSPGAGHTSALLQIIDDAGAFQGWVGVEASLHGTFYGGAVVAAFTYDRL